MNSLLPPRAGFVFLAALAAAAPACAQNPREPTVSDAAASLRRGDFEEAIRAAGKLLAAETPNLAAYWVRAGAYEESGNFEAAIADYEKLLEYRPDDPQILNAVGAAAFKNGAVASSIAAFDAAVEQDPAQEAHHWRRGISYYYAERFEEGEAQFQMHRAVNPQDVENAVWHFLCAAPSIGIVNARARLIPIDNDARVPMMEIYNLFRGEASADEVLERARQAPSPEALNGQMFYAHLYLGLYHEAWGRAAEAAAHVAKAAHDYPVRHYMGHVARVHQQLRGRGE